ncbi:MAG: hypothetical protein HRU75_11020 [Planctomycetia bacterium]|nr:MAG: hypothetical protein HRU75_11020 [Planctomycetia bacterium]
MLMIGLGTVDLLTGMAGVLLCAVLAAVAVWRRHRERAPTLRDVERERKAARREHSALAHSLRELADALEAGAAQATERAEAKLTELAKCIIEADARIAALRALGREAIPDRDSTPVSESRPIPARANPATHAARAQAGMPTCVTSRRGSIAPAAVTEVVPASSVVRSRATPPQPPSAGSDLRRGAALRTEIVAALDAGGVAGRIARELRVPLGEVELMQEIARFRRRSEGVSAPQTPRGHAPGQPPAAPDRN